MRGRVLSLLVLVCLTFPVSLSSYTTKSVFLVIVDGVRNQEVFEDSTHAYAPRIWNDLRPLGTIYTNFYTLVRTVTTAGHTTLLTGVPLDILNNFKEDLSFFRSRYPTIFEYYRSEKGMPADSVWMVVGKPNLLTCNYGLHPSYGPEYGPTMLEDIGDDTTTYEVLTDVLDTYHPRLMLINFRDVDKWGHLGDFEPYARSIEIADSLVFALYNHLQGDPFYRDNVTLFVTTDHGRIDDLNGGFRHHGLGTHGDRSCFFLALGPDIKQNEVVDRFTTFVDVAPTIGELLGFETPFAEGKVMVDMLQEPAPEQRAGIIRRHHESSSANVNLSASAGASLYPSLTVSGGNVHVVWSEEDMGALTQERAIVHVRSADRGSNWSVPEVLFENVQNDGSVYRGDIASGEGAGIIATASGYYGYTDPLGKRTYDWFAAYRTSANGGSWDPPTLIGSPRSVWKTMVLNPPRAALDSVSLEIDWITESYFTGKESEDGGHTLTTVIDYIAPPDKVKEYLSCHDIAMENELVYFTTERNSVFGGEIYVVPYDRAGKDLLPPKRIDPDADGSFRPGLGAGNGIIHVVWADTYDGYKGIYHRKSTDGGRTYSPHVLVSEAGIDSWNPDISVRGDSVIVVWEDYRDRWGEIYARRSADGGETWDLPERETSTTGFSVHPRVELTGDAAYLVWQDYSSGNWETCFTKLP